MKNDDEMYRIVLSRREEYRKKKEKRIRTFRRTAPVLVCLCFTVVFGLRFGDDLAKFSRVPRQPDIIDKPMTETSETTAAADTTESSSMDQEMIIAVVSTTISAQNAETGMVAATGSPQMQTVTAAVSGEESYREPEHETIEHTETQTPVTTAPVVETEPVIEVQTTPVQTVTEAPVTIVYEPEPITTEPPGTAQAPGPPPVQEPFDPSVQEPVAPPAQPISFDDITAIADAIYNNDVSSYPEQAQEVYLRMFERIRNDNFVYQPLDNELISLREDLSVYLFPDAVYEDVGIGYYATYKGKLYHVTFCYADPYVVSRTDGIAEYLKKRMGRRSDKEIVIQNQTVSELITNDNRIYASSFIDSTHYYDIVTSASEDEVMDFLSIFSYEQIHLKKSR